MRRLPFPGISDAKCVCRLPYSDCSAYPLTRYVTQKTKPARSHTVAPTVVKVHRLDSLYCGVYMYVCLYECMYVCSHVDAYNLRTRPHNFALPVKDELVSRSLYAELK